MKSFKEIISIFGAKKKFTLAPMPLTQKASTNRHWTALVVVFLLLVAGVLYTNISIFQQIESGEFFAKTSEVVEDSSVATLNLIDSSVEDVDAQNLNFENAKSGGADSVDPSR